MIHAFRTIVRLLALFVVATADVAVLRFLAAYVTRTLAGDEAPAERNGYVLPQAA